MPTLIIGLLVFLLLLWAVKSFSRADPKQLAAVLKALGGVLALAFAAFLAIRGQVYLAIPIGAAGLSLLGWMPWSIPGFGDRVNRSPGQASRVRSRFIEMELDHDTGAMRGHVVAGRHQGTALDALDVPALLGLLPEIDSDSQALLMAYLDRRAPGWREDVQGDFAAGQGPAPRSGKMTPEEAYQILGIKPGASAEDIGRAHRSLMKKLHPDQGGSTYLAARVNEAKEILLRRHR
jgi:DnaJ-domain-containing protein 1